MRIAKWTAITVGSLVLLLVATAFVLTSVVDPNRYRGKIEGIVADLAGRPFVIEGNLAITWYPWLGIRTGAAHLDNAPGVTGPPLLEWQSITVAAKVWPLLHGEVEADRIRLEQPSMHLRRDAKGHGNWEGLGGGAAAGSGVSKSNEAAAECARTAVGPASGAAASTADGEAAAQSARCRAITQPAPSRPVQIAGVEIRGGTVDYVDEASGLQATLANLDLDVGEWRAGQPLPVHTRFLAHAASLPPAGVWIQLDAPELTIRSTPAAIATAMPSDAPSLSVSAPKLTLNIANAQATGDVTYEQTADARTHAHGSVVLTTPSLRQLATDLALNQTLPHDPTTLGPLELTTTWTYDNGTIAAKPLALKLDEVSFNGWLQRTAAPKQTWAFELHGDRIDLGRYVTIDSKNKKPFELPTDTLRALKANGSVIFDQVVLADTHMADVRLQFQTPEGPQ